MYISYDHSDVLTWIMLAGANILRTFRVELTSTAVVGTPCIVVTFCV